MELINTKLREAVIDQEKERMSLQLCYVLFLRQCIYHYMHYEVKLMYNSFNRERNY